MFYSYMSITKEHRETSLIMLTTLGTRMASPAHACAGYSVLATTDVVLTPWSWSQGTLRN